MAMANSIWTYEEIQEQITLWKKAYTHCAAGKSFSIAGRSLTRQDLGDIKKQLAYLKHELDKITGSNSRMIFVTGSIPRA